MFNIPVAQDTILLVEKLFIFAHPATDWSHTTHIHAYSPFASFERTPLARPKPAHLPKVQSVTALMKRLSYTKHKQVSIYFCIAKASIRFSIKGIISVQGCEIKCTFVVVSFVSKPTHPLHCGTARVGRSVRYLFIAFD